MKIDSASGWCTPPLAARVAGDEAYRVFDSAEAALAFVARSARNAAKSLTQKPAGDSAR
jgi:hypothetical protein